MPFQRLSLDVLSLLPIFPLPVRLRRQRARTSHRANEISAQTENRVWSSRPHRLYSDVRSLKMALRSSLLPWDPHFRACNSTFGVGARLERPFLGVTSFLPSLWVSCAAEV